MKVGVVRGNGIGPEIVAATQKVLSSTGLDFEWVEVPIADAGLEQYNHPLPRQAVDILQDVKVSIKAPLIVKKLQGRVTCRQPNGTELTYPSLNNAVRRECRHFVNPRPIKGYAGVSGRHEELNIIVMREVTEDVYIGHEHAIGDDVAAEAIKLITRAASLKVAEYSFEYARKVGRKRLTCLHKANVLNFTDGLFLRCFYEVAKKYPDLIADDMMIDAACYTIVRDPQRFDILVTPNQYGDIFSDLAAGLIGSLGLAPGANIGDTMSMFEASHGAAPDIAGKGIANPVALILSGALLLEHIGKFQEAKWVQKGVEKVLTSGTVLTRDLGGKATTTELTDAICEEVETLRSS